VRFSGLWGVCGSCPVAIPGLPVRWCMCRETQPLRRRNAPLYRTGTPQHHFCAPGDGGCHSNLQPTVFMGGAVARCCFLAESKDRQKRGKCERNGVVSAREPAMGTQGCMYMMQDFVPGMDLMGSTGRFSVRCATAVSLPASASPAPVTTRVRAPATRPAFSFCSTVRGGPAWAAPPLWLEDASYA
jgi:hypothetical protein